MSMSIISNSGYYGVNTTSTYGSGYPQVPFSPIPTIWVQGMSIQYLYWDSSSGNLQYQTEYPNSQEELDKIVIKHQLGMVTQWISQYMTGQADQGLHNRLSQVEQRQNQVDSAMYDFKAKSQETVREMIEASSNYTEELGKKLDEFIQDSLDILQSFSIMKEYLLQHSPNEDFTKCWHGDNDLTSLPQMLQDFIAMVNQ